jgi:hypothetical protein
MRPEREEQLLEMASALAKEVAEAPIHLLDDPRGAPDSLGVPPSCVGNVVTFLDRSRDLERLREFVDRLDRLDRLTGQNVNKPRAHHRALQGLLVPWLEAHRDLSSRECLYVLSWVRRLVPASKPEPQKPGPGRGSRAGRPNVEPGGSDPPNGRFGQMAQALEKFKKGS